MNALLIVFAACLTLPQETAPVSITSDMLTRQSSQAKTPNGGLERLRSEERAARSSYVLGADDQIIIRALEAEEISDKPFRINMSGSLQLPMIGRIRAAGLTVEQFENELAMRLKEFIREPQVSVMVTDSRSQPVSVMGSVKNPGVHQLQGRKTLLEMLALAGGSSDDAGSTVNITRRLEWGRIPLATAADDPTGQFSVAEVRLKSLIDGISPEQNIVIRPEDVIAIPRAEMVYVMGRVIRSGGFVINHRESMSVLQALTLAGGLDRAAAPQHSRIMRRQQNRSERVDIAVNVQKILAKGGRDVQMQPDDILVIPESAPKKAFLRGIEAAIQVGTGIVIWRR